MLGSAKTCLLGQSHQPLDSGISSLDIMELRFFPWPIVRLLALLFQRQRNELVSRHLGANRETA